MKRNIILTALVLAVSGLLMSCQKTERTSTAGGGASSQSVLTFRGATQ